MDRRKWWALGAVSLSLLVVGLDTTVLNVALPAIAVQMQASNGALQWFADSYLLALAALLLPAGMIGDRFGRKRLTLGALAVFGAGSLFSALAQTPGQLIAARTVLGIGAAVLLPLAMSAVVVMFTPAERAKATSVLAASTMLGLPAGPLVGGALLQHFWWGSVFLINLPVVAIALVAAALLLPTDGPGSGARIDVFGAVLVAVGLTAVTYGVIEGPERGWSEPLVLISLIGGAVVVVAFVAWELQLRGSRTAPVMDVALWSDRAFAWGTVLAALASFTFFGVMFVVPVYLRGILGADAMGTGVKLLPMIGGMLLGVGIARRASESVPLRTLVALGSLVGAIGVGIGALLPVDTSFGMVALWTALVGAGVGACLLGAQTVALNVLTPARAASGSALIQTMRQVGSVIGIAVLGAVLNGVYRAQVVVIGLPAPLVGPVRSSALAGLAVGDQLKSAALIDSVRSAYVAGMHAVLWISAAVALVTAVLAFRLPTRIEAPDPAESQGDVVAPVPA